MQNKNQQNNLDQNLDQFGSKKNIGNIGIITPQGIKISAKSPEKPSAPSAKKITPTEKEEKQPQSAEKSEQKENKDKQITSKPIASEQEDKKDQQEAAEDKNINTYLTASSLKVKLLRIKQDVEQILFLLDKSENGKSSSEQNYLAEDISLSEAITENGYQIIEGIFTGEDMIGPDDKRYTIPANYASKSKLVEGDLLKLIIEPSGKFIYKQIGPIERERITGTLIRDDITDKYYVLADNRRWQVLTASVTFFKGKPGDEIIILIPEGKESEWATVENIIKK